MKIQFQYITFLFYNINNKIRKCIDESHGYLMCRNAGWFFFCKQPGVVLRLGAHPHPCKKNFRNERLTLEILGLALCLEFTKALTNLRKKVIN